MEIIKEEREDNKIKLRSARDISIKLLNFIPDSEFILKYELKTFNKKTRFVAPEVLEGKEMWEPLINILKRSIDIYDCEWKYKVLNIINGKIENNNEDNESDDNSEEQQDKEDNTNTII
jgi:hypothetical protein